MKTLFPNKKFHIPKWFIIDATGKTLGRLVTEISKLLRGKETSYFFSILDQGNFVIILNVSNLKITGRKNIKKLYYSYSNRPGNLKSETFKSLLNRIPNRILEKAVQGMLPKCKLGKFFYKRLYIYKKNKILVSKNFNKLDLKIYTNWTTNILNTYD